MEATGLLLGAIPIVLEALKQYRVLYRACKRFRKCDNGVEELLICLKLQSIIFENESRLLLADALGTDHAKALVSDLDSTLWQDAGTIQRVDTHLGESKDAIIRCGQDIQARMKCFEEELKDLGVHDTTTSQLDDRSWRRETRKRFKFAFSESKLSEVANSIMLATKEYRVLRSQVRELAMHKPEPEIDAYDSSATDRVMATRSIVRHIYELLAAACTLHTKHHAQLGLQPQYGSSVDGKGVKFQIAYRHLPRPQAGGNRDLLWFIVGPAVVRSLSTTSPASSAADSSRPEKRASSPSFATTRPSLSNTAKRVRYASPISAQKISISTSSPESLPHSISDHSASSFLPIFSAATNLCTQLQMCCQKTYPTDTCIGWLGKYGVYPSKGPKEQTITCVPGTLSEWLARKPAARYQSIGKSLSLLQRLNLAKSIAIAVLNCHSTPWMPTYWTSHDIFLYPVNTCGGQSIARDIAAFVEVSIDQQVIVNTVTNKPSQNALVPYVRNITLFNLAVILIELAFETPLSEMVQPIDCKPGSLRVLADINAAMRLCTEVSTCLGRRYAKIVEQCLFCAFGQGTNLLNPALQKSFQKDVISELEKLAVGFQNLIM